MENRKKENTNEAGRCYAKLSLKRDDQRSEQDGEQKNRRIRRRLKIRRRGE